MTSLPALPRWIIAGRDPYFMPPRRRWYAVFCPRRNPPGYLASGLHFEIDWRPGSIRLPRLSMRVFRVPMLSNDGGC